MRALATALTLALSSSAVTALALEPGAASAPAPAPSAGARAASSAEATPTTPASAAVAQPATPAAPEPRRPAVVPTQAVVDKVGLGDRLMLAGDLRAALFAYQDAVYAQPAYAPARVRLGRAYLALRYPGLAISQAEMALAEEPENADASKLLDEARKAPPRAMPGAAPAASPSPAPGKPGARVFKLTQEPDAKVAGAPAAGATSPAAATSAEAGPPSAAVPAMAPPRAVATAAAGAGSAAPLAATGGVAAPLPMPAGLAPAAEGRSRSRTPPAEPVSAAQKQVAALHYRTALGFLQTRDWSKAVAALSDALLADPTLAVAYSARGSAQFGLGKYREASDDYTAAMRLDPRLGTPLYGLAECYRVLGDGKKAAEMYDRYAQSSASDVRADLKALAAKRARELR